MEILTSESPSRDLRKLIRAGEWSAALKLIRTELATATDPDLYLRYGKALEQIPQEASRLEGYLSKRVAILGGYTTSMTAKALAAALFRSGIHARVWESEYGLLEHAIRSGDAALAEFKPDVCFFAVGSEHLNSDDLEAETARWTSLWTLCHGALHCPIVQNTFIEPTHRVFGNFELKNPKSRTRYIRGLNMALVERAPAYVHFNDVEFMASLVGRKNWRDEKFYDLAKLPVAQTNLVADAQNTAQVIAAIFGQSKKCLVLDLDNTLWGGVVGDDGLGGIKIGEDSEAGEAFKRFQVYIRELKNRGVILAVCSKNEEANAKEPFEKRSDMILKLADISCFVANWEPKHLNIQRIAKELNIGLDSFVFADDNPAEREIVRRHLPEVAVIEMPLDPALYTEALARSGYFETVSVTAEDLARTEQYRANQERVTLEESAGSYEDYLLSLHMQAAVERFDEAQLPRITQLINKTNQFNLLTKRYSEAEVRAMMLDQTKLTRYVKLRDRFGDNGLIAVFVADLQNGDVAEIDTWLMSCRVLKRDVERLVLDDVIRELRLREVQQLNGTYAATKKNGLVQDLLPKMGFAKIEESPDGARYSLHVPEAFAARAEKSVIEIVSKEKYGESYEH